MSTPLSNGPSTVSSSKTPPLEVLLLCDRPTRVAETLHDHISTLVGYSRHHLRTLESFGNAFEALDFERFDVVVIHYSLVVSHDHYVSPKLRAKLRSSHAIKAVFIQDEYRHIDRTIESFREIGLDILFTCVPQPATEAVYSSASLPGVTKINVLTGYVSVPLLERAVPAFVDRRIDVGYRARKVPAWLGDLGQEKWTIGRKFLDDAQRYGLYCDIGYREEERLYGEAWIEFLTHCKATLGVESGSSVFDFTGAIQSAVDTDLRLASYISYAELKRRHFAAVDGLVDQRQISPRCFEAAALRTLMVLYRGRYSGLLEAWRHYVPLEKDHSNMNEVVSVLRDPIRAQAIIDTTYKEIACNPSNQFAAHTAVFDEAIEAVWIQRNKVPVARYSDAAFAAASKPDTKARRRRIVRYAIAWFHFALFGVLLRGLSEKRRDAAARHFVAILWKIAHVRQLLGGVNNHRN
jgi:hypothetical protein